MCLTELQNQEEKKLKELKGERNKYTITPGDFKSPPLSKRQNMQAKNQLEYRKLKTIMN